MKLFRRILLGLLILVIVLAAGIALSVPIDRVLARGKVGALGNTVIPASETAIDAYLATPAGFDPVTAEPLPAVIMIHEFWGIRAELIAKADALAAEGYVVLAPDTFRGNTTSWLPTAIWQTMRTPLERVNGDLDAVYSWLAAEPGVDASRIMVMGFCYGGGKALRYSLTNPALAATGIFYGTPITDSAELAALNAPVLGIFGREDASISVADVEAFEAGLAAANIPHQITLYDDVGHAFVETMEGIRAGGQDAVAWNEFLTFTAEQLGNER